MTNASVKNIEKSIPHNKSRHLTDEIKLALKSKNINKLTSIRKKVPPVSYEKIDQYLDKKYPTYGPCYELSSRIIKNSLDDFEVEILDAVSSSFSLYSSFVEENPIPTLKEIVKDYVHEMYSLRIKIQKARKDHNIKYEEAENILKVMSTIGFIIKQFSDVTDDMILGLNLLLIFCLLDVIV